MSLTPNSMNIMRQRRAATIFAVVPSPVVWTFVSANNQIASGIAPRTGMNARVDLWPHYFPQPVSEITLAWNAWFVSSASTGALTNIGNDLPNAAAYAQCNGVVVPLTFGDSAAFRVVDGSNDAQAVTLTPAMFGLSGSTFPAGPTVWSTTNTVLDAAGQNMPTSVRDVADTTGSQSAWYNTANTTPNLDQTGAVTFAGTAPTSLPNGWVPFCTGKLASSGAVIVARGNSITANTGDAIAARDGRGWF